MKSSMIPSLLLAVALVRTARLVTAGEESSFRSGPQDQIITCESYGN